MKQSAFKNFVLFKPRTRYVCKKCGCTHKVTGDTWLEIRKSTTSVDNKKAFRIFWLCHSGHRMFRGYNRPVSWKKNLGGDKILTQGGELKSFEDEDNEIEFEYKEMVAFAKRMKESGGNKKYH